MTGQPLRTADAGYVCTECGDEFDSIEDYMEHVTFDHDMDAPDLEAAIDAGDQYGIPQWMDFRLEGGRLVIDVVKDGMVSSTLRLGPDEVDQLEAVARRAAGLIDREAGR